MLYFFNIFVNFMVTASLSLVKDLRGPEPSEIRNYDSMSLIFSPIWVLLPRINETLRRGP